MHTRWRSFARGLREREKTSELVFNWPFYSCLYGGLEGILTSGAVGVVLGVLALLDKLVGGGGVESSLDGRADNRGTHLGVQSGCPAAESLGEHRDRGKATWSFLAIFVRCR